ncbi:MAG: hypothetical protein AAB853_03505 [Patescibacteria group bacterium]
MLQSRRRRHGSYQLAAVNAGERHIGWIGIVIIVALVLWGTVTLYRAFAPRISGERQATILTVHGEDVRVVIGGEDEQRAESGLRLYDGAKVTTVSDAASLQFFDDTMVTLGEGSVLTLEEIIEGEEMSSLAFRLDRGEILLQSSTGSHVLRSVETPLALHSIPPRTRALLVVSAIPETGEDIAVFDSMGQGIETTLRDSGRPPVTVIIGEGQELHATPMAIREIKAGTLHPYDLRTVLASSRASSPLLALQMKKEDVISPAETPVTPGGEGGEQLVLTSPADGAHLTGETVLVEGTVGQRVVSVRVNGYAAEIRDGRFAKEIALGQVEEITIEVQAEDRDGITVASKTLSITRDIRPPDPPVMTFPGGSGSTVSVGEDSFEIIGEASEDTAGIVVNGYQLQKFVPGKQWRYLVDSSIGNVKIGENIYSVVALDRSGNRSAPVRIIILWKAQPVPQGEEEVPREQRVEPGSLRVIAPTNGPPFETSELEILIEGETSPNTAALSINGFTLRKYVAGKETWNYIAREDYGNYKMGTNLYTIVARNAQGQILDVLRYTIERK